MLLLVLEWIGTIAGIGGALAMSAHKPWSAWAYAAWLVSSVCLTAFGVLGGYVGLALLQAVFTVINVFGIYRWLVQPARAGASRSARSMAMRSRFGAAERGR